MSIGRRQKVKQDSTPHSDRADWDAQLRCHHINTDGKQCRLLACVNQKYCAYHGGKQGYASILSGGELGNAFQACLTRESPLDITHELALQRVMLSSVLTRIRESKLGELTNANISIVMELTKIIAVTAKIMSQIENNVKNTVHIEDIKVVCDQIILALGESGIDDETLFKVACAFEKVILPIDASDT